MEDVATSQGNIFCVLLRSFVWPGEPHGLKGPAPSFATPFSFYTQRERDIRTDHHTRHASCHDLSLSNSLIREYKGLLRFFFVFFMRAW